jgi:hypothetical protein
VTQSFTEADGGTSGTLTIVDGNQQASLSLAGAYTTSNFTLAADLTGGTLVKFA